MCTYRMHNPDYGTAVCVHLLRRQLLGCGDGAVDRSAGQESIMTWRLNLRHPRDAW